MVLFRVGLVGLLTCGAIGCNSPYHSDRGALFGGLTGAGVGALVGNAVGNTGAGAAVGAGVGALSGAAVGSSLDEMEARNRAQIEAQLGRQVAAGAVTIDEVVAMTRSGVADEHIVNHVRAHGVRAPLTPNDLILLQNQGVSTRVISAMQTPPPPPVVAGPPGAFVGPPVIVEEVYGPPWGPPYPVYHRWRPRQGFSWGVSVGN